MAAASPLRRPVARRHAAVRARKRPSEAETGGRVSRTMDVVIYHNPGCGTSRNTLALIRGAGIEPHVVEYMKTPPARALLVDLIARAGLTPRALLREKGTPYAELGLGDTALDDEALLDAMMAHPILINRPLVVTPLGVRLCRPSETVREILPPPDRAARPENAGEAVAGAGGASGAGTAR